MTFQVDSGVTPDLGTFLVEGKLGGSWALVTNNPGSLNTTREILRPRLGILRLRRGYKGYMTHTHTLETGLHMIPRSLVAPSRGARGLHGPFFETSGSLPNGLLVFALL